MCFDCPSIASHGVVVFTHRTSNRCTRKTEFAVCRYQWLADISNTCHNFRSSLSSHCISHPAARSPPMMLPRNSFPWCSVAALAVATLEPSGSSSSCRIFPSGDSFITAPHTFTGGRQLRGDQAITARNRIEPRYLQAQHIQQLTSVATQDLIACLNHT